MERRPSRFPVAAATLLVLAIVPGRAQADPATCQSAISVQLQKFKRLSLKAHVKCLRFENLGKLLGCTTDCCPDATAQLKIATAKSNATTAIAAACSLADAASLGFPGNCSFEATATGVEAGCAALPVMTPGEFAQCLECWKGAELAEFVALLFASHANEFCNGLDETSPVCSDLDCTTPLPDQRNLGNTGENDCQTGIAKAGVKYLLKREKVLEKCALAGGTRTTCLADPTVQLFLVRATAAKDAFIKRKCGNRVPTASPPFCCRTGTGNACTVVATRTDCTNIPGATVQEGKTCNGITLNCDPVSGPNKPITWWETCPESDTCTGTLATIDDLTTCVDTSADTIVNELLCLQFPRNTHADWPCPTDMP
jgi:hypothetical protein